MRDKSTCCFCVKGNHHILLRNQDFLVCCFFFSAHISNERGPVSFAVEIAIRLHESKQNVVEYNIFNVWFSLTTKRPFRCAEKGRKSRKIFQVALSCAKSIKIIVGLLQGIKKPLARRASEVLKNISEQTGRAVNR